MVTLRPNRDDDVQPLVELAQRAFAAVEVAIDATLGTPLDRLVTPSWAAHHDKVVRDACSSPDTEVVVAEVDDTLAGFVSYLVHPASPAMSTYGEVTVIAVDPDHRGLGIGRRLLDHAVAALRASGAPVIMVATGGDEGHAPARALYETAGFRHLPLAQYWLPGQPHG